MAMRNALENLATESTAQEIRDKDISLLQRIVMKALAKLTFTLNGLRTEAVISSGTITTVTTVTTVASVTNVAAGSNLALGRLTADGQGIQQSYNNFQTGFRRNLTVS